MQGEEIQPVVDALANRLGRSVAVDDPSIRLIAASRHFGDEDKARVRSVLDRTVPSEAMRWLLGHGIADQTGPARLPANPELGAEARVCVPVRCNGLLLGFLWLIDPHQELGRDALDAAVDAADTIGVALYRRMLLHERERFRVESCLRLLISPDREDRERAAGELRDDQLIADVSRVVLFVVETEDSSGDDCSTALEAALEHVERGLPPHSVLFMVQSHRAVVVLGSARPYSDVALRDLAERIRSHYRELTHGRHRCTIGISATRQGLDDVADAHREASTAVRAAWLLPTFGDIATWSTLGPFALLLRIDVDQLTQELPLPGLKDLLTDPAHRTLMASAEEFLDRAGDVTGAAKALHVHRTTLYHRLNRVETVTGLSLNDGLDRLVLHLALKINHLHTAHR